VPRRKNRAREKPEYCIMVRVLDPEVMRALRASASRQKCSVAEIVRTYIAWGQEAEEKAPRLQAVCSV
jgi:hypothetical protein